MKYILKGIQCRCFLVMSLLTGPGISPQMCGRRGNRDGDKLLCNMPAPRISEEAETNFKTVGSWFEEEKFTYVRLFGSLIKPHVLPLYVLDKLLDQELAYQITVEGTSKTLKDSKKHMWPKFPLQCGIFTLHDYKHAEKEIDKIQMLNLSVVPNRKYDPRQIAYNITSQAKLAKFDHEANDFDDLSASPESLFQVK